MRGSGPSPEVKLPTNTFEEASDTAGANSLFVRISLAVYLAGICPETSVPVIQGKER